ncbi:MAG: heterodisulfide reductase-related iron-sulfur binding cluster [Promethearchaeota archaeon]
MEFNDLALNLEEIEKKYPESPLKYFRDKKLCLFKACLERYFPGVRWGMQDLLEGLELEVSSCKNQSCCSGTFFQRNLITRAQFAAINERNIYELEKQSDIVLFSCNGCYNSLMRGKDLLKQEEVKRKTQKILDGLESKFGSNNGNKYKILENPKVRFIHDLDFLYLIKNDVVNSLKYDLKGLKVAAHYGCHYLNLARDKRTVENYTINKTKLEELVDLFGGNPVDYSERELCCGWGASQVVIHPKDAMKITNKKLSSAEDAGADFILMPCPTCLYTLSKPEYRAKIETWYGRKHEIPTIHINELIAILRGCEEERCISLRRKTPRLKEIYDIITER